MLSGIQPSGDLHLGNYLGAIKNWADRVDDYECYYFMADMHTITVRQEPSELRRRSLNQLAQYIACGLDPEKNVLFLQSHAAGGWISKTQFADFFGHGVKMSSGIYHQVFIDPHGKVSFPAQFVPKTGRHGGATFLVNGMFVNPGKHLSPLRKVIQNGHLWDFIPLYTLL